MTSTNPKSKPRVMLDLETLGTSDNAAIIQIAAVRFWPEDNMISPPEAAFSANIDLKETPSDDLGVLDVDTVMWWMKQSPQARAQAFDQANAVPMCLALVTFEEWLGQGGGCAELWSDSTFDFRLIRQAFQRNRIGKFTDVVRFYRAMDWRTLRNTGKDLGVDEPMFVGDRHVAINDAYHQAGWAINIIRTQKGLPLLGLPNSGS